MAKPRRQRRSGSLGSLKSALWATITYNLGVIEDGELDHELKQRACNSLTQAALAYAKVVELYEQQKQMDTLEHLADGNGHRRRIYGIGSRAFGRSSKPVTPRSRSSAPMPLTCGGGSTRAIPIPGRPRCC